MASRILKVFAIAQRVKENVFRIQRCCRRSTCIQYGNRRTRFGSPNSWICTKDSCCSTKRI